ncbi:MAG: ATP-binding protein [Melioribacteraceae bacterium]|nr:ATP-binding protein [Melioribacteraceae bacterium]
MNPQSLFSVENPVMFGLFLMFTMLAVIYVYNRFIIIPMRRKHLAEEENLKLQQAELMALFASLSPDPIFRFDEEGKIILANNSAHKLFPQKILEGENVRIILPYTHNYDFHDIIKNEKSILDVIQIGKFYYQFIIVGSNKFKICQVYGRNITELKQTENELIEALLKAEEAKRLKEFFLAQISHEIRSPLNVIVGYSDILNEELKGSNNNYYDGILRSIKNNSKRLYRTFDLLLNMSQLQAGKYETHIEKIDLYYLLNSIHLEYFSLAEEKSIDLKIINTIEPPVYIYGDHYSISQIFINLIDNAIKYTSKGAVEIKISKTNEEEIVTEIIDNGKGMSQEFIDKLFQPFTQEDMGYTRRFDGTGLGLAIVKNFVELNKGKISVESELNKGTTFKVVLKGDKTWLNNQMINQIS